MKFPLSFHTGFLSGLSAVAAVRTIRAHGYDMAELNAETLPWGPAHIGLFTPKEEIDALAALGPYSALCIHHRDFGSADPDRAEAAAAWTGAMMDRAVALGITLVHVIPGEAARIEALHQALAWAAHAAGRGRLTLALEPIVGRAIGTTAGALAAIDAAPGLKINFDPSHLHPMGDNVSEAAKALSPHIAHVHLKDVTGTREAFRFVPIGTGEIDLAGMLRTLLGEGYDGPISIEHESHYFADDRRNMDEVLDDCRRDFGRLMREARA